MGKHLTEIFLWAFLCPRGDVEIRVCLRQSRRKTLPELFVVRDVTAGKYEMADLVQRGLHPTVLSAPLQTIVKTGRTDARYSDSTIFVQSVYVAEHRLSELELRNYRSKPNRPTCIDGS